MNERNEAYVKEIYQELIRRSCRPLNVHMILDLAQTDHPFKLCCLWIVIYRNPMGIKCEVVEQYLKKCLERVQTLSFGKQEPL